MSTTSARTTFEPTAELLCQLQALLGNWYHEKCERYFGS